MLLANSAIFVSGSYRVKGDTACEIWLILTKKFKRCSCLKLGQGLKVIKTKTTQILDHYSFV